MRVNPFEPNKPVNSNMFAGRGNEIKALDRGLFQTKNGKPENFIITGERGIGKSSLLLFLKFLAAGNIPSLENGNYKFIIIKTFISDHIDLISFIKLIERQLSRALGSVESIRIFLKETWGFVQRLKVMDSGISQKEMISDPDLLLNEFAYSLAKTVKRITNPGKGEDRYDGIIFLIDEADNANNELKIGYFIKNVTELLHEESCNNVSFILAGLNDILKKLRDSHPSSLRNFKILNIESLNPQDTDMVVEKGIKVGNELNNEIIEIDESGKDQIRFLSEGYPHLIQQFAYSAYEYNNDLIIDSDDVLDGAMMDGGAVDEIGRRYYVNDFYDRIKSDEYRQVLTIMAENWNSWVKKKEIREKFSGEESVLNNALSILTKRNIILKNQSKIGEYRLQQKGFSIWIRLFSEKMKKS